MKIALSGCCLLFASAALAQTTAPILNAVPAPMIMAEHVQRATQHSMAQDDNLRGSSAYSYGQGEQPMWEFGSGKVEVPLGDVARAFRQQRAQNKKAQALSTND